MRATRRVRCEKYTSITECIPLLARELIENNHLSFPTIIRDLPALLLFTEGQFLDPNFPVHKLVHIRHHYHSLYIEQSETRCRTGRIRRQRGSLRPFRRPVRSERRSRSFRGSRFRLNRFRRSICFVGSSIERGGRCRCPMRRESASRRARVDEESTIILKRLEPVTDTRGPSVVKLAYLVTRDGLGVGEQEGSDERTCAFLQKSVHRHPSSSLRR